LYASADLGARGGDDEAVDEDGAKQRGGGPVDHALVTEEFVQIATHIGNRRGIRGTEVDEQDGAFGHASG